MAEERAFWLAWSQINGIGPILLRRLHKHFGSLAIAWEASPTQLAKVEGFGSQTAEAVATGRRHIQPDALLQQHEQENPAFCTPADPLYPRLLLEIPDPPPVLYYRGNRALLETMSPMVGIVGTRSPSKYGREYTRRISAALAKAGFTVVSGLAEGIDTEAHRSCLESAGQTIAVLGCAVNVVYPWSNQALYKQLLETGLALSEHPADTQPDRIFFPRRNRIIAGLCRATLVMEAPAKSGALITAHYANEYGRDVYALPDGLDNSRAKGCLNLIDSGAAIIVGIPELVASLSQVSSLQNAPPSAQSSAPPSVPKGEQVALPLNLDPNQIQVLQLLTELGEQAGGEAISLDHLVAQSSFTTSDLLTILLHLEMEGQVTQLPGMRYQRS
jgi:DNA processing protein